MGKKGSSARSGVQVCEAPAMLNDLPFGLQSSRTRNQGAVSCGLMVAGQCRRLGNELLRWCGNELYPRKPLCTFALREFVSALPPTPPPVQVSRLDGRQTAPLETVPGTSKRVKAARQMLRRGGRPGPNRGGVASVSSHMGSENPGLSVGFGRRVGTGRPSRAPGGTGFAR
jgi:hypothetical protein